MNNNSSYQSVNDWKKFKEWYLAENYTLNENSTLGMMILAGDKMLEDLNAQTQVNKFNASFNEQLYKKLDEIKFLFNEDEWDSELVDQWMTKKIREILT